MNFELQLWNALLSPTRKQSYKREMVINCLILIHAVLHSVTQSRWLDKSTIPAQNGSVLDPITAIMQCPKSSRTIASIQFIVIITIFKCTLIP